MKVVTCWLAACLLLTALLFSSVHGQTIETGLMEGSNEFDEDNGDDSATRSSVSYNLTLKADGIISLIDMGSLFNDDTATRSSISYDLTLKPDGIISLIDIGQFIQSIDCSVPEFLQIVFHANYTPPAGVVNSVWPINVAIGISEEFGCVDFSLNQDELDLNASEPTYVYRRVLSHLPTSSLTNVQVVTEEVHFEDLVESGRLVLGTAQIPAAAMRIQTPQTVRAFGSGTQKLLKNKKIVGGISPEITLGGKDNDVGLKVSATAQLEMLVEYLEVDWVILIGIVTARGGVKFTRTLGFEMNGVAEIASSDGEKTWRLGQPIPITGAGVSVGKFSLSFGGFIDFFAVAKYKAELVASVGFKAESKLSTAYDFQATVFSDLSFLTERLPSNTGSEDGDPDLTFNDPSIEGSIEGFGGVRPQVRLTMINKKVIESSAKFDAGVSLKAALKLPKFDPKEESEDDTCKECHLVEVDGKLTANDFEVALDILGKSERAKFNLELSIPLFDLCFLPVPEICTTPTPSPTPSFLPTPSPTPSYVPTPTPAATPMADTCDCSRASGTCLFEIEAGVCEEDGCDRLFCDVDGELTCEVREKDVLVTCDGSVDGGICCTRETGTVVVEV
eukprot:CAMPEP_0185857256 /NCGR_PEP_ID=MMETSP1354-20130828/29410_1 /TAXON_ID=708628 /ORGANISM="Erythrolobus madagascarensis, Strain CCMP3276" /LENGTH=617 /DNA_ID=CAMNT_0028559523 /DNA_START=216 /DNA_END=2070 /DNA_ORIENTATION=-